MMALGMLLPQLTFTYDNVVVVWNDIVYLYKYQHTYAPPSLNSDLYKGVARLSTSGGQERNIFSHFS